MLGTEVADLVMLLNSASRKQNIRFLTVPFSPVSIFAILNAADLLSCLCYNINGSFKVSVAVFPSLNCSVGTASCTRVPGTGLFQ